MSMTQKKLKQVWKMIFTKLKKMSFEDSPADPSAKEGKRAIIKPEIILKLLQETTVST